MTGAPDGAPGPGRPAVAASSLPAVEAPWQRLDHRVVWVDAARILASFVPLALPVVLGAEPGRGLMVPLLALVASGVMSAAGDLARWARTRYRVTPEHVELRSGWAVRNHRSVRRDLIRSVDITAKLHHRLAGLRVVTVRGGQQVAAGEATFSLDALSSGDAEALRRILTDRRAAPRAPAAPSGSGEAPPGAAAGGPEPAAAGRPGGEAAGGPDGAAGQGRLIARFRWGWLPANVLKVWGLTLAPLFVLGSAQLLAWAGLDPDRPRRAVLDWARELPVLLAIATGAAAAVVIGVVGLAASFVGEWWDYRLVRLRTPEGSVLRSRQGLFRTREVDRDDRRLRGITIGEPLCWSWAGLADTELIATGLGSSGRARNSAATVLPRCPLAESRRVAAAVLGTAEPLDAPLRPHPAAARRRRLVRAVAASGAVLGVIGVLAAATGLVTSWPWALGLLTVPVAVALALAAYGNLGHATTEGYLVARTGVLTRRTDALQRRAVIGCIVRQSLLQRQAGVATVAVTTAAGSGLYELPDVAAGEAADLALHALPEAVGPLLAPEPRPHPEAASARTGGAGPGGTGHPVSPTRSPGA